MVAWVIDPAFWALLALVVFTAVVIYLKVPGMLAGALDRRAEAIKKELEDARRLREEAQSLLAEYQRKAREAGEEAESILDQARREAAAIAADAKQRTEDYVARRTRMAEDKIARAEAQALQEVRTRSAEIAIAAAQRVLAEKVKGPEAERLVESGIAEVKTRLN
jgi:F-type H+-transporting ATPase subunit b